MADVDLNLEELTVPTLIAAGPWEQTAATQQSKFTLEQHVSKQRYWIRVRAVNEDKTGDWCDPVTKAA